MIDSKVRTESEITGPIKVYDGDTLITSFGSDRSARYYAQGYSRAKLDYIAKILKWLDEQDAEIVWGGFYYSAAEELRKKIEEGEL